MIRILSFILAAALFLPLPARAQDITTGLVSHWTFDETSGTTAADSGTGGNSGTLTNSPTWSTAGGKQGGAVEFAAGTEYITMGDQADLDFGTGNFTVSAWIKTTGFVNHGSTINVIVKKVDYDGAAPYDGYYIGYENTNVLSASVGDASGNTSDLYGTTNISDNLWHHVALVKQGGSTYLYVDGNLEVTGTVSVTGTTSNTEAFSVGGDATIQRSPDGLIDDVRVYSRALSAGDVLYLSGVSQGRIRYNTNSRAAEYFDGGTWIPTGDTRYVPVAAEFDTYDYLTRGTSNLTGVADGVTATGSFWFRRYALLGTRQMIWTSNNGGTASDANSRFRIELTAANRLKIIGRSSTPATVLDMESATQLTDTNWHHVMFSFDLANGANRYLYIDGVTDLNGTPSTHTNTNIDFSMTTPRNSVGARHDGILPFDGYLSDFWLDIGRYADISNASIRAEFVDSDLMPVNLGSNGSEPFGAAPDVYLTGDLNAWQTNKGGGGGFTENGSMAQGYIKSPGRPAFGLTMRGSVTDGTNLDAPWFITAQGNYAYVGAENTDRLTVIDVSNPASPTISGSVNDAALDGIAGLAVSGNYVFAATPLGDGFTSVNVSNPASPTIADSISDGSTLNNAFDVTIKDNYAFVTAQNNLALTSIDISDPNNLVVADSVSDATLNGGRAIAIQGDFAYITTWADQVTIVDISDPQNMVVRGSVTDNTNLDDPYGIVVSGNYAYVAAAVADGLTVVNIADPDNPFVVNRFYYVASLDGVSALRLAGNHLYIASSLSDSITVADISDPVNPLFDTALTHTDLNDASVLAVVGNYAYVTSYASDRVTVVEITPPDCANPTRSEGTVIYNTTSSQMQFCNGADWIAMGPPGNGGGGCSNPGGTEGAMVFNSNGNRLQYCEGSDWIQVGREAYAAPTAGLALHWPLDETSGNTIADSSGNGNTGTWFEPGADNVSAESVAGKVGTAIDFATSKYVQAAGFTMPDEGTFSAWVTSDFLEFNNPASNFPILFWAESPTISILYNTSTEAYGINTNGVFARATYTPPADITDWFLLTTTWSTSGTQLYLNGVAVGTAGSGDHSSNSPTGFLLGTRTAIDREWDGKIDDVRIYDRPLNPAEVYNLYRATGGN